MMVGNGRYTPGVLSATEYARRQVAGAVQAVQPEPLPDELPTDPPPPPGPDAPAESDPDLPNADGLLIKMRQRLAIVRYRISELEALTRESKRLEAAIWALQATGGEEEHASHRGDP